MGLHASYKVILVRSSLSGMCAVERSYLVDYINSCYSWSRDGRYLLTSSQDWKCILWDLEDGSRVRTVRFEAPVYIAELHPFNQYSILPVASTNEFKLIPCIVCSLWSRSSKTSLSWLTSHLQNQSSAFSLRHRSGPSPKTVTRSTQLLQQNKQPKMQNTRRV